MLGLVRQELRIARPLRLATRAFAQASAGVFSAKASAEADPRAAESQTADSPRPPTERSDPPLDTERTVSVASAVPFSPLPGFTAAAEEAPRHGTVPRRASAPHRLHVQSTRNNTIVTLTMPTGEPLASASGGSVGFKKANRSGYEAGYRAALRVFDQIAANRARWQMGSIEMLWNGFGQGREAVFRALLANEGEHVRTMVKVMTDKTPIKIGGVRPKKRRML
ncbi:hypothetical protein MSPP1_002499 [Malassezia sp. CBS 17886]|nr:hypothetical protein MSPP1_002499 [Malassezia sp. CBS 17886]